MKLLKSKKQNQSFRNKIKNFFKISEEFLKEEPTREFKQKRLVDLTRTKIFIALAAFFIIVNALVLFDIDFIYLRQIFGFLFLALIPGLLIMLCFKIREVKFWEYLVYTVGLSIAFIMFGGLAVNWTLPALGITDKPLSLYPILICFDIFLIALGVVAWKRNADLTPKNPIRLTTPKLDTLNSIFFIIPMFFPILAILGAFLLNNHGPNILTMIMLGGIAVYVFLLVLFRKKLNENVYPWAILLIFLSFLLMFTLRSWFISGWDISQEQYIFRLTSEKQVWSTSSYKNSYNSCLSLSILPTIMSLFLKASDQSIFKLFIQIIFVSHSLIIFLIFRRYISYVLSFVVSFLYFGIGNFNSVFPTHIRLEIAFIFFGLIILVLFTNKLNLRLKKVLFLTFGASMIISHYSTTYIALGIFTLTYVFTLIYKLYENRKIKKRKMPTLQRSEFYLTGFLVLSLLVFGFLWLSQLTPTSDELISVIKISTDNLESTFTWDGKHSSIQQALLGKSVVKEYTSVELRDYINETKSSIRIPDFYPEKQTQVYSPTIMPGGEIISPENVNSAYFLFYLYQFIKYSIILSFVFGFLFICFSRKNIINKEFSFMIFLSVLFMILMILLPYLSKAYTFLRLYQQVLIFLSLSSVVFFQRTIKNSKNLFVLFIAFIYLGYSLFSFGFLLPISGGDPTLNLYNKGFTYNALYSHGEEITSINWFIKTCSKNIVYMDPYSNLKFYSFGDPMIREDNKIIPFFMGKNSYVYSNFVNKIKKINYWDAREKFNNGVLSFNFPTSFLDKNKNKIYNNGGSEVFR